MRQSCEPATNGRAKRATPMVSIKSMDEHESQSTSRHAQFLKVLLSTLGVLNNEKLQIVGPVVAILAVGCADCGARALAYWPSSPLLWYLNLEVFLPIRHSVLADTGLLAGNSAQTLCVIVPLFALIGTGLAAKVRFPIALASNVSLVYGLVLLCGSYLANSTWGIMSSSSSRLSLMPPLSIVLSAFLSAVVSHRAYLRDLLS
jgi:hypothetical protein